MPCSRSRLAFTLVAVAVAPLGACRPRPVATPVRAEFLVLAGDSTFWVKTTPDGIRVRGSPLQLARYGGRFYEIYLADDDRSYEEATFVGERIYRRDIVSGDSLLVFADTVIANMAHAYSVEHPDALALGPNEEPPDDPGETASSEIVVVGQHGPYLSYEYRADASSVDGDGIHAMRRGVLDLRSGDGASVADLFGATEATRVLQRGRSLFKQAMDSVRASTDARARAAAPTLSDFTFDAESFAVIAERRTPQVEFVAPGRGPQVGGFALTLQPITVAAPSWWGEVTDALAEGRDAGGDDRWTHDKLVLLARDHGEARGTDLVLVDSAHRRWPAGRVSSPVWRVYWLEHPAVDSASLRALSRAFADAALYSDDARTASFRAHRHRHAVAPRFAAARRSPGRPRRAPRRIN
ncbi:MAG: hypothetical protein ABJD07_04540 [Gemmatimonadaceae bacterium]